jgi:uncharacterized repeat protein (TIGR03803 family)
LAKKESNVNTTKITQTLALARLAPAGKLSHLYSGLLPVLALFAATLGKLKWGKRAYAVLVLCAATAMILPAQTFTTLASFDGTNGQAPAAQLVQATNGDFYGITTLGGANGAGTVFKISPGGTLTTLYSFCSLSGCVDGADPTSLVQATNGDFYGTTASGGASGNGTVFKITTSGTLTTLHSFAGYPTDGSDPEAGLVQATNGDLYGTTFHGGANNPEDACQSTGCGTVFKTTPTGTLTTLYSFCSQGGDNCTDGSGPRALVQATNGEFYGATVDGGAKEYGTVFKMTPGGTLTTLYSFCSQGNPQICPDGGTPEVLIQATNGDFYGTTNEGGINSAGTIFRITSSGTLTTLYRFCSQPNCTDGVGAHALVQATDSNFYGITGGGGANADGTVFKITPSGTLTTLYSFCSQIGCTDGGDPDGVAQATNGDFYGTTYNGGANSAACDNGYGCGVVFSLSVGLGPFVETQTTSGEVGALVEILGTDLTGATSVSFNGTVAAFTVVSPSLIAARVPAGATTGTVQVVTPSGTLSSKVPFRVLP